MHNTRKSTVWVLIMEDLFYTRTLPPHSIYDLKGKTRAQKVMQPPPAAAAAAAQVASSGGGVASTASGGMGVGGAGGMQGGGVLQQRGMEPPSPPLVPLDGSTASPPLSALAAPAGVGEASGTTPAALASPSPPASGNNGLVLLDGDLMAYTRGGPLPLTEDAKRTLDAALARDTAWLTGASVVDYSLLVGVESGNGVLSLGIIDYVRRFDAIKRLESRVKTVTSLATNGVEPTVVQPSRYAERLLKAADRYAMGVPHAWSGREREE